MQNVYMIANGRAVFCSQPIRRPDTGPMGGGTCFEWSNTAIRLKLSVSHHTIYQRLKAAYTEIYESIPKYKKQYLKARSHPKNCNEPVQEEIRVSWWVRAQSMQLLPDWPLHALLTALCGHGTMCVVLGVGSQRQHGTHRQYHH